MMLEDEEHFPHRRVGEQRLEMLTNSPVAKLISWLTTTIFLPIVAWGLITLLGEVRQINEAIAKNNTVVALYDLRITSLERTDHDRDTWAKTISDETLKQGLKIENLERDHQLRGK